MFINEEDKVKGVVTEQTEDILAFLMVGQSNMAGRGNIGDVPPIENERCIMYRIGMWHPMVEPINVDKGANAKFLPGIGPAASFADEMSKHTTKNIGLIPCAQGGSKIEEWQPGEALFDNAVFTAKLALRNSTLGGIIWHQGESNCRNFCESDYREKFMRTVKEMRRLLSAENVPFILGEISEHSNWGFESWTKEFNESLHKMAKELPLCAVASEDGLTLKADGIHFDAKSCRIFGKRYFEKYMELTKGIR